MIPGNINTIALADIERLIADRVAEGKTIEYKSALPGGSDGDKREFLADVSSFANTSGGDLVYGIEENQGIPERVMPLAIADIDLEQRRLDSLIRDGIRPRLTYAIRVIGLPDNRRILVIRVGRGWTAPYRVTFQGHDKFYARTTAGKYPLDVDELRTAFTLSQTVIDKIRTFRVDRTISLSNNITPIPFRVGGKIVLHCIPFNAFGGTEAYDVLHYRDQPQLLRPFRGGAGWQTRITLEGILSHSGNPSTSYTHLFRNGIIESVEGTLLNIERDGVRTIPSVSYEQEVLRYLPVCFSFLRTLGVAPPIAVALTLTNVRGVRMSADMWNLEDNYPIDADTLSLPEVVVDRLDEDPARVLKPIFDLIWNACGQPGSRNFDAEGRWIGRQ
jgi:hypothetical protein